MADSKEMLVDVKIDLKDVKTDNLLKVCYQCFDFFFSFFFCCEKFDKNFLFFFLIIIFAELGQLDEMLC